MAYRYSTSTRIGAALIVGILWGSAIWAINTWLILPWANETMLERQMVALGWWFAYHVIYGGMLFLVPLLTGAFGSPAARTAPAAAPA
jgi:hypothetical protein